MGWLVSAVLASGVLCGLYNAERGPGSIALTREESASYFALARIAWSVAVGWTLFACATGNGGYVNRLLSAKVFVPLSRLTYCAYLLHPRLMTLIVYYSDNALDLFQLPLVSILSWVTYAFSSCPRAITERDFNKLKTDLNSLIRAL